MSENESYRGYEFQVFELPEGCDGCGTKPGQWNANLYQPGYPEPIGYCYDPQDSEKEMRSYMQARIDRAVDATEAREKAAKTARESAARLSASRPHPILGGIQTRSGWYTGD
jgi:hypothetical protein